MGEWAREARTFRSRPTHGSAPRSWRHAVLLALGHIRPEPGRIGPSNRAELRAGRPQIWDER